MRRVAAGVAACVTLVAVAAGAEPDETIFERLRALDEAASADRGAATQRAEELEVVDEQLAAHWAVLDVAQRAARPIRHRVTQGLAQWLEAHRATDREAMDAPVAAADTRRLLDYASKRALPLQLRDADVVRRADEELGTFQGLLARRGAVGIDLARATATAFAATDAKDGLLGNARRGEAAVDLDASDAAFEALLGGLDAPAVKQDFHRRKGTLARPVTRRPEYHFGAREPLMRPSGWTYRPERGEDVHAVGDGAIVHVGVVEGRGLTVVVEHGGGYRSVYSHLDDARVEVGADVKRAEVIASAGDSGSLDGVRFYFELRRHGAPVDPEGWFLKD